MDSTKKSPTGRSATWMGSPIQLLVGGSDKPRWMVWCHGHLPWSPKNTKEQFPYHGFGRHAITPIGQVSWVNHGFSHHAWGIWTFFRCCILWTSCQWLWHCTSRWCCRHVPIPRMYGNIWMAGNPIHTPSSTCHGLWGWFPTGSSSPTG